MFALIKPLPVVLPPGDLILHVEELDQTMVSSIVSSAGRFCLPPTALSPTHTTRHVRQPFHEFDRLLLTSDDERRAIAALITKLEEGEMLVSVCKSVQVESL